MGGKSEISGPGAAAVPVNAPSARLQYDWFRMFNHKSQNKRRYATGSLYFLLLKAFLSGKNRDVVLMEELDLKFIIKSIGDWCSTNSFHTVAVASDLDLGVPSLLKSPSGFCPVAPAQSCDR